MKTTHLIGLAAACTLGYAANADVLWDQSDVDLSVPGFFDHENGGPPFGMSVYTVNDIAVTGQGWNLTGISTYYSAIGDFVAGEARLHIFEKTGALPSNDLNDPTLSTIVPVTTDFDGVVGTLSAAVDINLDAGDYWIGLTPITALGDPILLSSMSSIGDASASYDANAFPGDPEWFNMNPGGDAAIKLEGTQIPAPGALAPLALGGLVSRRRRA